MGRRRRPGRRLSAAILAGLLGGILAPASIAIAAPDGRIQQVETAPGRVTFLFTASGIAEGQSIDPSSIKVTLDGQDVLASAVLTSDVVTADPGDRKAILVLDSSGSMADAGKLKAAKAAAEAYLAAVPADVRVGLISFADAAKVRVAPTQDRAAVSSAIEKLKAKGSTAMFDAIRLAVSTLGTTGGRNIVLLSDGQDEGSKTKPAGAARAVAKSGVVLDAVSLGAGKQAKQLAALVKAGGGSLVTATDADAPARAFEAAARAMNNQLQVIVTVPEGSPAGTTPLIVTALVDGAPVTDTTVAQIAPGPVDSATFGPREVAPPSGVFASMWVLWVATAVVFLALLMIGLLAVNAIDPSHRKDGRIARRLMGAGAGAGGSKAAQGGGALGEGAVVRGAVDLASKAVGKGRGEKLERRLQAAGVPLRASEWVVVHALTAALAGLAAALLSRMNAAVTLFAILAGAVIPWLILGMKATKRKASFYEALPETMQLLAGSLTAGYSLPQALDTVARESHGAMGQEISRALLESRLGIPIEASLESVATRMQSKDFHWVVMAINLNRQVGGNLAEVLRTVGATLRERERLRRQVKSLSAEGRLSAVILGLLPVGLTLYMLLVRPEFIGLLVASSLGWILIGAGVIAMAIGVLWMNKIVKIEV